MIVTCGKINALKPDEIVTIKAGETMKLEDWTGFLNTTSPGEYRVRFYYWNIPDWKWIGFQMGRRDDDAIRRLKKTSPIALVSNEVRLVVTH